MSSIYGLPYSFVKTGPFKFNVVVGKEIIGVVECHNTGFYSVNWKYKHKNWFSFRGPVRTRGQAAEAIWHAHLTTEGDEA
jgi:hypothetical protein